MPKSLSTPQAISKVLAQFTTTGRKSGIATLRILDKAMWRLFQEVAATIQYPRADTSTIHQKILGYSGFNGIKRGFKDVPGIGELAGYPIPNKFNNEMFRGLLDFPGAAEFTREVTLLILTPIDEGDFEEMTNRLNLKCCSKKQHSEVCKTKWMTLRIGLQNYVPRFIGFNGLQPLPLTCLKDNRGEEDACGTTAAVNCVMENKYDSADSGFYESTGFQSPSYMIANGKGDSPMNEVVPTDVFKP